MNIVNLVFKGTKKDALEARPKKASIVKKFNTNILSQKLENKKSKKDKLSRKELAELDKTLKRLKKYMK
jgi:hypothetical protein